MELVRVWNNEQARAKEVDREWIGSGRSEKSHSNALIFERSAQNDGLEGKPEGCKESHNSARHQSLV